MTRFVILAGIAGLALAGCGTVGDPMIKTIEVDKPVPVSCVPKDMPTSVVPSLTPAQLLTFQDAAARYQALAAYYLMASPRLGLLEGVISACRSAAPAPAGP